MLVKYIVLDGHYPENNVNDSNLAQNIYFIRSYSLHLTHCSLKCKNIFRPSSEKESINTYIQTIKNCGVSP
jgi:hypothetical protein